MKKIWAILCVVGFTGFWAYALAIAAALFGERLFVGWEALACLAGLALGLFARLKILGHTPKMHGQRAKARARLEEEFLESELQH